MDQQLPSGLSKIRTIGLYFIQALPDGADATFVVAVFRPPDRRALKPSKCSEHVRGDLGSPLARAFGIALYSSLRSFARSSIAASRSVQTAASPSFPRASNTPPDPKPCPGRSAIRAPPPASHRALRAPRPRPGARTGHHLSAVRPARPCARGIIGSRDRDVIG